MDTLTDIIEFEINQELSSVKVMEFFIKDSLEQFGEISLERFTTYADYVLSLSENIDSVAISPDGVIQFIVPLEQNKMMVGFELFSEMSRSEFVKRSVELKRAVAQGPVETKQGSQNIFNRLPIFIERDSQEIFWGLISISINFERFMESHQSQMETDLFSYVIHAPLTDQYTDFYWGDRSIYDKDYIDEVIYLPELTWRMAVYPKKGWYQYIWLDLPYLFIGILFSILAFSHANKIVIGYQYTKKQARTDSLTGCSNRLVFDQLMENKTILEKNNALFIVDVDDFKGINDTFGHSVGDSILKELVSIMRSCIRESDQIFRVGGDEFVILLNHIRSHNELTMIAQRLINDCNRDIKVEDNNIKITLSIGIATSSDEGTSIDELFKLADVNLYRSKEKGKNQFSML